MSYIMCFSCGSSVLEDLIKTKMVCEGTCVGGICDDCTANVRTFKVSFTREVPTGKFVPLQFQCLEVFKKSGKNPYGYDDDDEPNN